MSETKSSTERVARLKKYTSRFAVLSCMINTIYAIFNLYVGVSTDSNWGIMMFVYLMVLALLPMWILMTTRPTVNRSSSELLAREIHASHVAGFIIILLVVALSLTITLIIRENRYTAYPTFIMIPIAIYSVGQVLGSVISRSIAGRLRSPYLMTFSSLGLTTALIALIPFEVSMIYTFNTENDSYEFANWIMFLSGILIAVILLLLGITLIRKKQEDFNAIREN